MRNSVSNPRPRPAAYQPPEGEYFSDYPLRLEQLLAIRCPGIDGVPLSFLTGESEILDGNLRLCAGCPQNVTVRIVLAQTLLAMNRIRPEVVQEFRDEILPLQEKKQLQETAQNAVQRVLDPVLRKSEAMLLLITYDRCTNAGYICKS